MTNPTPPPRRPDDALPIHSLAELSEHWRALMGELGFSALQLWMILLDADGRPTPVVQKIGELPAAPQPGVLTQLMTVCRGLLEEVIPGGSVAFLIARPGPAGLSPSDRAWAAGLADAARRRGVACRPVHLANDQEIHAINPDDAAASA